MKKYFIFWFMVLFLLQGCLEVNAPLTTEKRVKCPNYLNGTWNPKENGKPVDRTTVLKIRISSNCRDAFIAFNNQKETPVKFASLKSGTYASLKIGSKPPRYYIVRYSQASPNRFVLKVALHTILVSKAIENGTIKTVGISKSGRSTINTKGKLFYRYLNQHHKKILKRALVYVRARKRDIAVTAVCDLEKLNLIQKRKCIRAKANNGFKQQAIIYHISDVNRAYSALHSVQRHLKVLGQRNASIIVVTNGSAAFILVNGSQDRRGRSFEGLIQILSNKGVQFEISAQDIALKKIVKTNLSLHARIVPSAEARIIDLQQKGYFYIKP